MDTIHDRRRHGDPFPLNVQDVMEHSANSGVFEPQRARWLGGSLNRLALHDDVNSLSSPILNSERQPTVVQHYVSERIRFSLDLHGARPEALTPESALKDLQAADTSYDGMPNNLASYDPDKLKVLRSSVQPKRITSFLPPEPCKLVEHYESQILCDHVEDLPGFQPYWDPQLRFDKSKRLDFILRLQRSGLVTLRQFPRSFIGAFFVKKKDPNAIRMVLDCRGTNKLHQPPPVTRLGSARCYADLDLSAEAEGAGWGIEADVNDAFYNFSIPELTHYFAFNQPLEAGTWAKLGVSAEYVYDPEKRCAVKVDPTTVLFPCVQAVPMGWSWALFLCNEAVLNICRSLSPWTDGVFRERKQTPQLGDFRTSLGVYVDNITIVGRNKEDVSCRASAIQQAFDKAGIPLTWSQQEPVRALESVGCVLDFEKRLLHNKPKRVWKLHLATLAMLRRDKLKGRLLQIWAGHFTSLCALTPWGLSCLQHVYRFIEASQNNRVSVWPSVRRELKIASAIVWMTWRDLGSPLCRQVDVGDSSSSGYSLMTCEPGLDRVRRAISVHEKWRFVPMPDTLKRAAELQDTHLFQQTLMNLLQASDLGYNKDKDPVRAVGLSTQYARKVVESLQEGSWLGTSAIRSQLRAPAAKRVDVDIPALIEPLDDFFADVGNYRILWARRWRFVDEHINLKEGRVALSSLRRACRVQELMGHRKLTVSDNMCAVSAFSKGRSSSFKMNRLCRIAAAIQFGCGILWHLRHVETKRNVADEPSRNFERNARGQRARPAAVYPDDCSGHPREPSQSSKLSTGRVQSLDSMPKAKGRFFLELFAGTGALTRAVQAKGLSVLEPVEICNSPAFDLRRRETQLLVLRWIKSGNIGFVHLGAPCTIWSRARHGVKNNAGNNHKEKVGIELALFLCEVIRTCNIFGVGWALENPRSSRLFLFEPLIQAIHTGHCFEVNFDMCSYGESFKKDTKILTSVDILQGLERHCHHRRHSVWFKNKVKHGERDSAFVYKNRAACAGAYPCQLCFQYADLLLQSKCCSCHGEGDQTFQNHWSTAIRSFTPKKDRPSHRRKPCHKKGDDQTQEFAIELLNNVDGLCNHLDLIACGREPKEAWHSLKKAKSESYSQNK